MVSSSLRHVYRVCDWRIIINGLSNPRNKVNAIIGANLDLAQTNAGVRMGLRRNPSATQPGHESRDGEPKIGARLE